jgi:ribosome-associated toxin RatA of RatAB toxin-antitoxin module
VPANCAGSRLLVSEPMAGLETIQRQHTIQGVSPRLCYSIITDYACYPRIFPEFTRSQVLSSEGDRRRVEFRAKMVMEVRYVLDIVQDDAGLSTKWTYVEGEIISDSVGGWAFSGDDTVTHINYHAGIAVKAPLPKFMINKISNAILGTSVPNMFRALEREAHARRKYEKP